LIAGHKASKKTLLERNERSREEEKKGKAEKDS
jgi:hypothetical protein